MLLICSCYHPLFLSPGKIIAKMTYVFPETIAAQATPSGRGGIGVVRVSGEKTKAIAQKILGCVPKPRYATFVKFRDSGSVIDEGISLYFPKPNSFTGEDVLELHGHGGPVVMDRLLNTVLKAGARQARPGEFSERAFLNNKIDLAQAEAVADLINASSEQAARSAMRSLQGEFSKRIHQLVDALIQLRMYIEASIDFPEEEIDFLADERIKETLENLTHQVQEIEKTAKQGALLREGITVVIAGEPNVGKSSLLNLLSGQETAIVTDIAGTTRDIIRESIHIDGLPIHVVDTAGLRLTEDVVEKEGVRRTQKAVQQADLLLLMIDASKPTEDFKKIIAQWFSENDNKIPTLIVENKIDLIGEAPRKENKEYPHIKLSVKTRAGVELLKNHLKNTAGFEATHENNFIARRRHCDAIARASAFLKNANNHLLNQKAGELVAEDLKLAQNALSEITGEFTSDDLLGKIFSEFCIGK
ncbi:tRNA uridine-5-carboxymethylaminomethyl(34) synthesis GTPase MnmE [Coxiella burnetii]|uniref:tRNA uridine-5-carboxymethylaminomethyl(34) synthesis GTPase MnmE n=1 Tax=Coxiella burnetii TaxID=777 RepID=UPI000183CE25|nr:tRNA uridine-5-carboxymethylaminomethyl(34) synthesis GTPase MnmE [Coxiella burnetii]ACJ17490.1 tRNA (5-carboxymethylaminomethyl-2-thiouridylate) synthase [Coxiella burnetii CbuG_Q212]OYK87074.1 tRNA modification GTPase [Coxiella burnetii]